MGFKQGLGQGPWSVHFRGLNGFGARPGSRCVVLNARVEYGISEDAV